MLKVEINKQIDREEQALEDNLQNKNNGGNSSYKSGVSGANNLKI